MAAGSAVMTNFVVTETVCRGIERGRGFVVAVSILYCIGQCSLKGEMCMIGLEFNDLRLTMPSMALETPLVVLRGGMWYK